jgi:hypothetical protein
MRHSDFHDAVIDQVYLCASLKASFYKKALHASFSLSICEDFSPEKP